MTWGQAVIFGVVEGLTEFLPVSSTGHLILTAHLLGLEQTEFMKSFEIAIQLGAILAVVLLYWRSFLVKMEIFTRVIVAFIPTAFMGFFLYKIIKKFLLSNEPLILLSLFLGGIILILFERWHRVKSNALDDLSKIPFFKCLLVGAVQSLAVIPGVSRAGATIIGGLTSGFTRKSIVEFSFLLAVPTILAATVLDLAKNGTEFANADWSMLLLGGAVSFTVALLSIRFFIHHVQNHGFTAFGIYRIFLAVIFWIFVR
jgi:undecaprenyl-diphosphatase